MQAITDPAGANPVGYRRAVRRRWRVIVVLTVIGLALGYLTAKAPPSTSDTSFSSHLPQAQSYQATSISMLVTASTTNGIDPSGLSLDAMAFFGVTGQVPRMVAAQLVYHGDPAVLAGEVQMTVNDKVGALVITSTRPVAAQAVQLVDAFATQLIAYLNNQIQAAQTRQVAASSAQLNSLQTQISSLQAAPSTPITQAQVAAALAQYSTNYNNYERLLNANQHTSLTVVQAPVAVPVGLAGTPSAPKHSTIPSGRKTRTLLGGVVGLLLGLALALMLDRLDTRIYEREEAEDAFSLPVLAEIHPRRRSRGVEALESPLSATAERYRMLVTSLSVGAGHNGDRREPPGVILLAPVQAWAGKSAVVANLAVCFRDAGRSVVAVAADAGDSSLASLVGPPPGVDADPDGAGSDRSGHDETQPTAIEGVRLIAWRGHGRTPAAQTALAAEVIEASRGQGDVVVVDTAPVLSAHDAGQFAASVDAVVLVCGAGRDKASDARLAVSMLRRIGAPLLGVVLVHAPRYPALRPVWPVRPGVDVVVVDKAESPKTPPEALEPQSLRSEACPTNGVSAPSRSTLALPRD